MSRLFPRIPKEISHDLPWPALLGLFDVQTITGLEEALKLKDGTLSKASRGFYASPGGELTRGLSANVHQTLLDGMAKRFSSADQMRAWMSENWPGSLLNLTAQALEALYENVDLVHQIPQVGTFPIDYIERNEKEEILKLLLNNKQVQVLWLTGPGGSGKSTLALSLVRLDWHRLKKHYEKIFWVNVEQANYADGLRQIAESIDMAGESVGAIEQKLRSLTRKSRVLFILDNLQDVAGLLEWQRLAGSLGKLIITSRTRLAENELRANGLLQQIQLGGFSLEQGSKFFADTSPAMEALVEKTGGLPLALRILSGLKLELGYSAQEIQTKLEQFALDALEYPASQDSRETSLRFCFDITYQVLAKTNPQAANYFDYAGAFQTRTILKTLLDDIANVANTLAGDKLTAILLRYNLVDVLNIKGERFIQLHPLLYEFAREKLALLTGENAFDQRYNDAIYAWVYRTHDEVLNGVHRLSHQIHVQDILHVLDGLMGNQQWQKVIWIFKLTFELFVIDNPSEGKPYELISFIEAHLAEEDLPEIILLRMMLSHRKSVLGILKPDQIQRGPLLELAYHLGKSIEPIEELNNLYWQERSQVLREMIQWLKGEGRDAEALALLNSEEAALVFSNISPD
ncbi:MAG: NB-ARC domain-containing protein, partial [Chloroflexi bacterium]|nr:NB-ARC domain-containing protein [Chloroflexota bacterium]